LHSDNLFPASHFVLNILLFDLRSALIAIFPRTQHLIWAAGPGLSKGWPLGKCLNRRVVGNLEITVQYA